MNRLSPFYPHSCQCKLFARLFTTSVVNSLLQYVHCSIYSQYVLHYTVHYALQCIPDTSRNPPVETNYRSGYRRLDGLMGLVGGEWGSLPSECSTSLFLFFRLKEVLREHRRCVRATGKRVTPMPKAFPLVISRAQACGVYFSIGSLENRSNYSS